MDEPFSTEQGVQGEQLAKDAPYWVNLAQQAYSKSTDYFDAFIRPAIEDSLRQFNSQHPRDSKYLTEAYKLKSKTYRPKTRTSVRKHEATAATALFSTLDVVNVGPVDESNETHRAAADFYKELLQLRLTSSIRKAIPWFQVCIGGYQEAMNCGVVAGKVDWERNPLKSVDRPRGSLIPMENLRIDPAADWTDPINTSPYVIHLIPLYVKDVKARMRDGRWFPCDEGKILSARTNSNDSTRMVREGKADSKDQGGAVTDYTVIWVHEVIVEDEGKDVVFYTLGTQHLLTKPVPISEKYFHGQRPFVLGTCVLEAHKTFPTSFNGLMKGTQVEINDLANQRLENIKLVLNKRYSVKRNKQVDLRSITRNVAGSVTMVNDHDDVKIMETPDVTSSAYAEQDRLNLDFDDLAGGFSGSSVASNRNLNETVGGMNLLSASGNGVSDYQLRTYIETFVEPFLRLLILTEREYETDPLVIELAAKSLDMTPEQVDQLWQQEVVLTVNVGMNNTNPQIQAERFIYGITALSKFKPELLQKLKDEDLVKELFGKLGYRDGQRFFDFEKEAQPDPLQEITIEKIKAEIEGIKAASAVKQVDAMVKRVETLYSAIQTGQVAATVPGVVPIADEIAKSAGFQDQNAAPIYPQPLQPAVAAVDIPQNTSPMFPAQPAGPGEGMMQGIETERADGVINE
jgi:hypothetical protein